MIKSLPMGWRRVQQNDNPLDMTDQERFFSDRYGINYAPEYFTHFAPAQDLAR